MQSSTIYDDDRCILGEYLTYLSLYNNAYLFTCVDEAGCVGALWLIVIVIIGALASIPLIAFGKLNFMYMYSPNFK